MSSSHGTPVYFTNIEAAQQAGTDIAAMIAATPAPYDIEPEKKIPPWLSGVGSIVSATFAAGNFAVAVANIVHVFEQDVQPGTMEMTVVNMSSYPVSLYSFEPKDGDVAHVPSPLGPGAVGLFLLTRPSDFDFGAFATLDFVVGAGAMSINVRFVFTYTDTGTPGRWQFSVKLDNVDNSGANMHTFPNTLNLSGAAFDADAGYPRFSLYAQPIETASGALTLTFYDYATEPPAT
jgi:hypothetical protein